MRPDPTEYAPYYESYIACVSGDDVLSALRTAPDCWSGLLENLGEDQEVFAYAPGKWSIREVLGHVIDAERMFSYRALQFARGDTSPLPGIDQTVWASHSTAPARRLNDLLNEFRHVRLANTALFASLDDRALARRGTASDVSFTVRALVWIVAGHELHHRGILEERYLPALR